MKWLRRLLGDNEANSAKENVKQNGARTMNLEDSLSAFLHKVPATPTCVRIPIVQLPESVEAVIVALKSAGVAVNQITTELFTHLRAICPACCIWIPPETLSGVHMHKKMAQTMGGDNVTLSQHGPMSHLLDGRCVLDRCGSREVFLIWKGSPVLQSQMTAHLHRIHNDAEAKKENAKLALLDELNQAKPLAFAMDSMWVLQRNASVQHLFLSGGFPFFTPNPTLVIWVSVIPYPKEMVRLVFPGGYQTFVNQILGESEHNRGDVSVAHWITMAKVDLSVPAPESRGDWVLNLTLASKLNLSEQEKFIVLPYELCGAG